MGSKKQNGKSMFENLISELMNAQDEESMLSLALSGNVKTIKAVPLRFRLIGMGFVKGLSLEEVNSSLLNNGCAQLYARSIWEASLIYAFQNGLSYVAWKELISDSMEIQEKLQKEQDMPFKGAITLNDVENYVKENSDCENGVLITQHWTQMAQSDLEKLGKDKQEFYNYLIRNTHTFSSAREKTRYYFCKYLTYLLHTNIDTYFTKLERALNKYEREEVLEKLTFFSANAELSRHATFSESEARAVISSSALSLYSIYDAFDSFYFEYLSDNWVEYRLLDYDYSVESYAKLSDLEKRDYTSLLRKQYPKLKNLTDTELVSAVQKLRSDEEEKLDASTRDIPSRVGENFLRKVLRGERDLDRTTFIAFLLFFGTESEIPEIHRIHETRLNGILHECGFPILDKENDCDVFFLQLMDADDHFEYLTDTIAELAENEENFYLYKTYLSSINTQEKWEELTGSSHDRSSR